MSGTYIGKSPTQAFLVQIVESSNGQLTGFYQQAQLTDDGVVQQENVPLAGARDGQTFTATLNPGGLAHFFGDSLSLSGTYSGSTITLVGANENSNINVSLALGSVADYQNDVAALNAQSQLIQKEKAAAQMQQQQEQAQQAAEEEAAEAAADLVTKIDNDLKVIQTVPLTVSQRIAQLDRQAQAIRDATSRMQAALEHEQELGGRNTYEGASIPGDISYANSSESYDISSLRYHLQAIEQNGLPSFLQKVEEHITTCQGLGATESNDSSFSGPPAELQACLQLESAEPNLKVETSQLLDSYQDVFSTWAVEDAKQQAIIQQASQ